MDFASFKAQLEASRKVEHTIAGITFQCVLPPPSEISLAVEANRSSFNRVLYTKVYGDLVAKAVIGWTGLTPAHFVPDAPKDQNIDFSAEARSELIVARQDITEELGEWLVERVGERNEQLEGAVKN